MKCFIVGVGVIVFAVLAVPVLAQSLPNFAAAIGPGEAAASDRLQSQYPGVMFDRQGAQLTRVYGRVLGTGGSPRQTAELFLSRNADLFAAEWADLLPVTPILQRGGNELGVMYQPETGTYKFTLLYFAQYRDGVPVFRSDIRLLVKNEPGYPLVWVGSSLRRLGDFRPALDRAAAIDPLQVAADMTGFTSTELVVWAGEDDTEAAPILAWTFEADNYDSPTAEKPEKWLYVVDAATGKELYRENQILFTDVVGSVLGMATTLPKSDTCNPEVSTPMPYAQVNISGGNSAYADANGNFTIPHPGTSQVTVTSPMTGQYFYVDNVAGAEETLSMNVTPPGPADFMHNAANTSEPIRAQINGYVQANLVRDWCLTYHPSYPTIAAQTSFPVYVNRTTGYCPGNAWYDGSSINFCSSSGSYPNTAYSSVVHHEYGHHMVAKGGSGQGEYGEGMSDCVAALIANDPILGYGFTGNCNTGIRNADNNCQYLASGCSTCGSTSHLCGQLLSGIVWSIRTNLMATEPVDYLNIISTLTVNSILLHTGTGINAQIAIDFLTLDDIDGNLANGTPHWSEICSGFSAHGLSCPALNPISFQYPSGRPEMATPNQPTVFPVNVVALGGTPVPGSGQLHYSFDGGAYTAVPMTQLTPNHYEAVLPAAGCDHWYNWYVSAQASGSGTFTDPSNAPTSKYRTVVATEAVTPFEDDFETDQGWTVGDLGDDATSGIWSRNVPQATTAQPGEDHTPPPGTMCWVTDYRAGSSAGQYDVDGGKTTLKSPTFDLSGVSEPVISYWRWYSNDKGAAPGADVFVVDISNNNGSSWVNAETVGPSGPGTTGGWIYHEFRVADFVTPTPQIRLRFVASDYGSGSLVEAALDDFEIRAYDCEEAPVCATLLGDMDADYDVDGEDIQAYLDCLIHGGAGCACANLSVSAFVSCLLDASSCP